MREAKTMGRPREFDADVALAQIMDVFWTKGFEGASMRNLVSATGLKKGSLYAAFGDKRSMYHKALALYDRTQIDSTVRGLKGDGPAIRRIDHFLQSAIDGAASQDDARGCFICNASIDQATIDPSAGQLVRASLGRLEAALTGVVSECWADAKGLPASAENASRHARHLTSVYFGLRVLTRAGAVPETLDDAKRAALQMLVDA